MIFKNKYRFMRPRLLSASGKGVSARKAAFERQEKIKPKLGLGANVSIVAEIEGRGTQSQERRSKD